ncbi:MAG: fluoride efflux transporter CrcB [Paracoccaceae bacterium]
MYWTILQVALGGAIGSVGRYLTGVVTVRAIGTNFPAGTMAVNIIGSFAMGVVFVYLMTREQEYLRYVPFVMTGVLGGFTTFSAFSLDLWTLFERGRFVAGAIYVGGSLGLSVFAVIAGIGFARGLLG